LCPQRQIFGMNRPGAFAERVAAPAFVLFPLPERVGPLEGALIEPLANAVHVWSLVTVRFPEIVVVIGCGAIGLLALQVARGGDVGWSGVHGDATERPGREVVLGERRITGSYAVTARDIETAIGLFAHHRIDVAPWVRPFTLDEGARVFRELLTAPPAEYAKAV